MNIYVSHAGNYNYTNELYAPLQQEFSQENDLFLPHATVNMGTKSKDVIAGSDVLFAEVSNPSTGQGIEIGWADANNIAIVCFYKKGSKVSSSLKFVSNTFIEYSDQGDMVAQLKEWVKAS